MVKAHDQARLAERDLLAEAAAAGEKGAAHTPAAPTHTQEATQQHVNRRRST